MKAPIKDHIREKCELAQSYANTEAWFTAARVLRDLARDVQSYAQRAANPGKPA